MRFPCREGKAHGHLHGWYQNGDDAFKGYFNEGVKQGTHITFFPKSLKHPIAFCHILNYNLQGKLEGEQTREHSTGKLWVSVIYKDGKANGLFEGWGKEQKEYVSLHYKDGILQKDPPSPPGKRPRPQIRIDEKYVNEVTREFLTMAKKEFGVTCGGSGGSMPWDVQNIGVNIDICKKPSIEESREIFVALTERFAKMINTHEKLRPYLREYPFPWYRAVIYLHFKDENGERQKDGSVAYILVGGKKEICYCKVGDQDTLVDLYEEPYEEPYEEALKIVKSKNSTSKK